MDPTSVLLGALIASTKGFAIESSLEYMAGALDRLGRGQDDLRHALPPGSEHDPAPPADSRETTPR